MNPLFFLGVGAIAEALRSSMPGRVTRGTTRGAPDARFARIEPIAATNAASVRAAARDAHVLVSFPPDGRSDRTMSELVRDAKSIAYLSSTAVYPLDSAIIDETSRVSESGERALMRLEAEAIWLERGASVVRLPAFYGNTSGLHVSLHRGTFRMPGNGANIVSRVHVHDAASFVRAALAAKPRSLLLAGDEQPAAVAEVVGFVCELFALPAPTSSEGEAIPLSLRASRSVDSRATRARFGVDLEYPTYREGYRAIYEATR